ncbi:hypothetical protein FISHEDRAFT_58574 [Fistulina hepatica ATCC 64428]|uniref:Uncharacterized protein n=1 Tax=Fistulina hepatica ATCC 64428 TaxID=1128425 RepID=A0A0D7ADN7_9AGAR|nr:hypothetical protein FISHEDRAFT_59155 [Fistulina hepatica ATCC 64428]KIY48993.1 hypothetical protein FISHEDRAFT_58574 [Fistulina hepatica ATCC 64428]
MLGHVRNWKAIQLGDWKTILPGAERFRCDEALASECGQEGHDGGSTGHEPHIEQNGQGPESENGVVDRMGAADDRDMTREWSNRGAVSGRGLRDIRVRNAHP